MNKTLNNKAVSPEARRFGSANYIKISVFGFALAALWGCMHTLILQVRLLDFVPAAQKNTYLGFLTFAGLVLAMAVQPVVGAISDRSGFSWGRRRPYILLGTIMAVAFLPGIGLCGSYAILFVIYCLLQISSNTAQGSYQGFIPDLVPVGRRGLASGVKTLLELLGGLTLLRLIGPLMDRYLAGEGSSWLWLGLGAPAVVLVVAMIATVLMVKERPGTGGSRLSLLSTISRSFKIAVKANPDFLRFLASRLLLGMPGTILQTYALYYLMDVVGIAHPAEVTGDLLIAVGVGMLVTVYPAGRLSDRVGRKPVLIFSGLLGALGVVLLFFSRSYMHIMFCGGLLGISSGVLLSTSWALAVDLAVKGEEARYLGLANMSIAGAGALSRLIGPVIDFLGAFKPRLGYSVMLLVCFVCFVVGSALLITIKGYR